MLRALPQFKKLEINNLPSHTPPDTRGFKFIRSFSTPDFCQVAQITDQMDTTPEALEILC